MTNKKTSIYVVLILFLAAIVGLFCYPDSFNKRIDNFNEKYNFNIWHFPETDFKLGLDLKGGVHLEYEADLSQIEEREREEVMEGLRDLIEKRINKFGVAEPVIQIYGSDRLAVDLPGLESIDSAIEWIGETPLLEFAEERSEEEVKKIEDKRKELQGLSIEEMQEVEEWYLAFESPYNKTELTGRYLKKASLIFNDTTSAPIIELKFDEEGARLFEEITERNVGKSLAIYLDGESIIDVGGGIYAPRINEKISGGSAIITGQTDINEARLIVQRLNRGSLPVPLGEPIVKKMIGPTLGSISLDNAIIAGLYGLMGVILFLIIFYRLPGLLASFALIIYCLILLGLIKVIPVTLTLAGIGGIILSVGMAVDANILIFSRMKEELAQKKDLLTSIEEGCNRAWSSIRDGNFTTLIVAFILYFLGTSFIKAFAFTLILGILISIFSAMVITKLFLQFIARTKLGKIKWLWF
jgi:protein-export membrane protein SecD